MWISISAQTDQFESNSEATWKGAAGDIFPMVGEDPFVSDDAYARHQERNDAIQRAHDFVVHHVRLPGRDVILAGLDGYQSILKDEAKAIRRKARETMGEIYRQNPNVIIPETLFDEK